MMKTAKNNLPVTGRRAIYRLGIIACLAIPLLYIHQQYGRWNPFRLNGRQFLVFFIVLLLLCHGTRILERTWSKSINPRHFRSYLLPLVALVTGVARLAQGIGNAKPVGYLVLLLALHLALLIATRGKAPAIT